MTKLKYVLKEQPVDIYKFELSYFEKLEFLLTLVNRLLIGFVTIYVTWTCARANVILWHAIFCTIGFICFMSEGLMAYYRGNAWTRLCQHLEKRCLHWILQLISILLGLVGICIKIFLEPIHFHTLHGQLGAYVYKPSAHDVYTRSLLIGLLTTILLFVSGITGCWALYAAQPNACIPPILSKILHHIFGLITYSLAIACIYTAYETDIFLKYSADAAHYMDFRILLKTTTLLICLLSILGPFIRLIYRKCLQYSA